MNDRVLGGNETRFPKTAGSRNGDESRGMLTFIQRSSRLMSESAVIELTTPLVRPLLHGQGQESVRSPRRSRSDRLDNVKDAAFRVKMACVCVYVCVLQPGERKVAAGQGLQCIETKADCSSSLQAGDVSMGMGDATWTLYADTQK